MPNNGRSVRDSFSRVTLAAVADTSAGELVPPTSPLRRIDLDTTSRVRREMSRVYREIRAGQIESTEGARLVYVLSAVGKMIAESELEARLRVLEERTNDD